MTYLTAVFQRDVATSIANADASRNNLYSHRHSTTQSQQCIKDQEVKIENNIPPKI